MTHAEMRCVTQWTDSNTDSSHSSQQNTPGFHTTTPHFGHDMNQLQPDRHMEDTALTMNQPGPVEDTHMHALTPPQTTPLAPQPT